MRLPIRVVVTGMAGTFPVGGPFWDYFQYVLGLHKLGHDVLYIEDTGQWFYSPVRQTYVAEGHDNAAFLAENIEKLEPQLKDRWYLRDACGNDFGLTRKQVSDFCRSADLFINISGACFMRDEYRAVRKVAFVDSDPMYIQADFPAYLNGTADENLKNRIDSLLQNHDVFFTFGENVHAKDCAMPRGLVDWIPTRQPIVMDALEPHMVPVSQRRQFLTTVGSWEPQKKPGIQVGEKIYFGKSAELLRFRGVAKRSSIPMELAIAGELPRAEFEQLGWTFADPAYVSRDPWAYCGYLATSCGEWSVAKNAYVDGHTGWFSCRTACYLALGVPAVVQDTGFRHILPTGQGLFAFETEEEALDGIEQIKLDPEKNSRAALEVAREHFASERVLNALIDHL